MRLLFYAENCNLRNGFCCCFGSQGPTLRYLLILVESLASSRHSSLSSYWPELSLIIVCTNALLSSSPTSSLFVYKTLATRRAGQPSSLYVFYSIQAHVSHDFITRCNANSLNATARSIQMGQTSQAIRAAVNCCKRILFASLSPVSCRFITAFAICYWSVPHHSVQSAVGSGQLHV